MKKATKNDVPPSEMIDNYINNITDWRGELLVKIRKAFHDADPEVVEEWKWMGSPVWEHDGIIAVGNAHKKKVKLTFYQGAHIDDKHKLFNAGLEGNKWRAIDLLEGDNINAEHLKELIQTAIAFNIASKKK